MKSRHILFLCVANSARSQMAEAIARDLAPPDVAISSAGSEPAAAINPLAVSVLEEVGIDSSGQFPKAMDEISGPPVETVVTLCDEEVCPAYLGNARRLHWPFLDPARAAGTDRARLQAFRRIRDELRRRLEKGLVRE